MNNICEILNICDIVKKENKETQTEFTNKVKNNEYNYYIEDDVDKTMSKCIIS